ncbi:NUDIX hydrolase [Albirhodobacter sp. R86504]|uniref:NUDIX hydrolase n=1 Tax=Albirhodobacter sp. R86504 TaxID=3093848 RepID=UPI00366DA212
MTGAGKHPIPAVLAVVIRDGQALLVQRANPPDQGLWGFAGGKIDRGETIFDAAQRELFEETHVHATAQHVISTLDAISYDPDGTIAFHYLLIAVLCEWISGTPKAADDALDARWIPIATMETELQLSRDVASLARDALAIAANGKGAGQSPSAP